MVKITPLGERLLSSFSEEFGITDKGEIARKLGFKSEQAVYKVIRGERGLRIETLQRFRNSTKRSIDWLLTGEGEKYIIPPKQYIDKEFLEVIRTVVSEELNKQETMKDEGHLKGIVKEELVTKSIRLNEVESEQSISQAKALKKSTPLKSKD